MANNLSFSNSRFPQHAADLQHPQPHPHHPDLMITHDFLLPPFSCSWSATLFISETRTIASSLCFLRRSFHPSKFWTIIVSISIIDATVSASSKSPLQSPQHHICYSFGNLIIHHQWSMTTLRIIKPFQHLCYIYISISTIENEDPPISSPGPTNYNPSSRH